MGECQEHPLSSHRGLADSSLRSGILALIVVLTIVFSSCGAVESPPDTGPGAPEPTVADGTKFEREGVFRLDHGMFGFCHVSIDLFPPGCDAIIPTSGVAPEDLDMFHFPPYDYAWSDRYKVTGVFEDGILLVGSYEYRSEHRQRGTIEDCEAALEHPDEIGRCPEWMVQEWLGFVEETSDS